MRAKKGVERIKKVILHDRTNAPDNIIAVQKSDIYDALSSFFDVNPNSIAASIEVDNLGMYEIKLQAKAFRVKGKVS